MNKDEIAVAIEKMTVLELADLVKTLEDKLGVSAAAPMAVAVAPGPGGGSSGAEVEDDEQTEFNVLLRDFGANKINVIKAVREVTTLGLKEAKELVEAAPATIKEGIPEEEAQSVKVKLEAAGATIEIK